MNNSEWSYQRIATNVKRWSFKSKMEKAFSASLKLVDPRSANPDKLKEMALPEEIETFVMLAVKMGEWQYNYMSDNDFKRVIFGIRNFEHLKLFQHEGKEFVKWFMMVTAATQFPFQTNSIFRIYRYYHYFTHIDDRIDMRSEFMDKFGVNYEDIACPVILIWLTLMPQNGLRFPEEKMNRLISAYGKSFDLLTLTREDYKKELDQITMNIEDYKYCLRPSYSWPFIYYEGERYLATPHLLIQSITVSLMHRLTLNKDELRENIGKNVLEPYLFKIISSSNEFDEVLPEQEYKIGKEVQRTLDVMASSGEDIVCFDSKSLTPNIGIRTFSEGAYEATKRKEIKAIVQAYKHIHDRFGRDYSFLNIPVKDDRSNIFALIIVADNPYLPLEELYSGSAKELNIPIPSYEYDWLRGHIGIAEIDMLEVQLFERVGIMDTIKQNLRSGRYSDNWLLHGIRKEARGFPDMVYNILQEVFRGFDESLLPEKA